jgi:fibro-slime domain-containing protein
MKTTIGILRAFVFGTFALALVSTHPLAALANGELRGDYFVLPSSHPDVGHGIDHTIVTGLVAKRLGPHGLPVVTELGRTFAGASGPITDVNGAGELMWYATTGSHGTRHIKSVTEALPFKRDAFFPPGQSADGGSAGYLTAHWSGSFRLSKAQTVGFTLGSDDDSWVFIDGTLVVDNGGVKPLADAPYTAAHLAAGVHRFDVFYADRHGSGAQLHLSTEFPVAPPASPQLARSAPVVPTAAKLRAAIAATGHVAVYGIHFAFDKADITSDSSAVLAEVAKVLRDDPRLRLRIEGHTDSAGDAAYNRDLSLRRAQSVKAYLQSRFGIAGNRLTTQGFGPDRPVATNQTPGGRFKNRRVELVRL